MLKAGEYFNINEKKMKYVSMECGKYIFVHEGNILIMATHEVKRFAPWKDSVVIHKHCNLYPSGNITTHASQKEADTAATPSRVLCFQLNYDSANPSPMRVL